MTPPRHLLATAAAATISLLTLSACGENSIYTSGDATGTETTTITQSTSRTSDRYDYHSSTKYNGNHSTERDSYRRSYRDRDGENYEVTRGVSNAPAPAWRQPRQLSQPPKFGPHPQTANQTPRSTTAVQNGGGLATPAELFPADL